MSKTQCPFREALINEQFGPAITATFGDLVDQYDKKMIKDEKLSHKNLITPADFYEICRKTAWYIYDDSTKIFKQSKKDQQYLSSASEAEFERKYDSSDLTPFYNALKLEFICGMNAALGSVADDLDEKMSKNPDLKLKDVLDPADFYEICRKVGWYLFDDITIFEHPEQAKTK